MSKSFASVRCLCLASILFAFALALRSWAMLVGLSLTILVFWYFKLTGKDRTTTCGRRRPELSEEEKDAIIAKWWPDPLVPEYSEQQLSDLAFQPRSIEGKMARVVNIDGRECLNLASTDFYSFIGNPRIEEVAKKAIFKYGVGACGPRNFYGTVDVHLDLEKELAEFMGCEEAILYSYGFPTIASAIPPYAKRGDIIFADSGVNFAIQSGLQASRSEIVWFKHNDTDDLERKFMEQEKKDKRNPKKAVSIRRFIIVEGIYAYTGDLCPLPKLIELKWRYKARIFMDQSFSFGVLGAHGKGVTEHFGVDVVDVDLISASLENAMATTGGFCCGRSFVIGHQRLSGLGYCFSASLPPLLATAASEALRILTDEPKLIDDLHENCIKMHGIIQKAVQGSGFRLLSVDVAAQKHIGHEWKDEEGERRLDELVKELFTEHILVANARFLRDKEVFDPELTVKISCHSEMSNEEMEEFRRKLVSAIGRVKTNCDLTKNEIRL